MGDAERDVGIHVKTTSDTSGIQQASTAVRGLDVTASQSVRTVGSIRSAMDGAAQAARGGTGAFMGLFQVLQNIWRLVAVNPFLALLAGIAAAGAYLASEFRKSAEAIKDAEEKSKAAADRLKEHLESLPEKFAERAKEQADALAASLKAAGDEATRTAQNLAAMEDAGLARDLAQVDLRAANEEITPDEAKLQRATLTAQSKERSIGIKETELRQQGAALERQMEESYAPIKQAEDAAFAARQEADTTGRAAGGVSRSDAQQTYEEAAARRQAVGALVGTGVNREVSERTRQRRIADADQQLAAAKDQLARSEAADLAAQRAQLAEADAQAKRDANVPKMDEARRGIYDIGIKQTVLGMQRDTVRLGPQIADAEVNRARGHQLDQSNAAAGREFDQQVEQWGKARAEREANMAPGDRLRRLQGSVQAYADLPGQGRAGGDVGRATQARAREAIEDAGARIQSGEDDTQVIDQLVETLKQLGAVLVPMARLRSELDALDGKIEEVKGQLKYGGIR